MVTGRYPVNVAPSPQSVDPENLPFDFPHGYFYLHVRWLTKDVSLSLGLRLGLASFFYLVSVRVARGMSEGWKVEGRNVPHAVKADHRILVPRVPTVSCRTFHY